MELERKEKIDDIEDRLDSILEILFALQVLDKQIDESTAIYVDRYLKLPIIELEKIKEEIKSI